MATPMKGYRKYIAIAGRRNAGKSTLINALFDQEIAITSDIPGTTTDPVFKTMELQPIGPVTIIDTPGIDDEGKIGEFRVKKAYKALYKADIGLIVTNDKVSKYEKKLIEIFKDLKIPFIVVINKKDIIKNIIEIENSYKQYTKNVISISALKKEGIEDLKELIAKVLPKEEEIPLIADLIEPGQLIVLVVPIDLGAPKGRLIMPQVTAIREILDREAIAIVTKERELKHTLENLQRKPDLVVTDSQSVMKVVSNIDSDIPLTTFSILEARHKGDLEILSKSVEAIEKLKDGDTVIIMEGCSHRPLTEDIGRVKIPRWLTNHLGININFEFIAGTEFPEYEKVKNAKLIIHCGGCTLTRKAMLRRINIATMYNIPIVNYGVLISYLHGAIDRALEIFPEISRNKHKGYESLLLD
ncbi:ATP-binding protein [Marinitoga sp. 1135]|uniref:[FeFe] hydrogenase H-cluster maturation GTPase HydF n=1 Tax=unclassified Marinitoga TaxID=2640159 RepID=UPI0009507869|nr:MULTISPECIES: [FeFe] hydrogenase H-cluster maturation GTPase HydF [unclassified Marinitoga]APT75087.1 ATP-binding protein [Marinitoga sp. 1137]NUU94860.1 ATP-binding protein [Marinitoga sp. 1135]NUU96798.1 ATP-binding protein [Marinitoga sp. 1138]